MKAYHIIIPILMVACTSTGTPRPNHSIDEDALAVLHFEKGEEVLFGAVSVAKVFPLSINGVQINQWGESWKLHAYEEFHVPPGDTIALMKYSGRDGYGSGDVRFFAKPNENYHITHAIKRGRVVFRVTDSQRQLITSVFAFKHKVRIYSGPEEDLASALFEAAADGDTKKVQSLLHDGAEPDWDGPRGFTSLIIAASRGKTDTVKALIHAGANVNAIGGGGWSALIFAADRGFEDVVRLLLDSGADKDFQNPGDYNALMVAAEKNHINVVKLLVQRGVYLEAQDRDEKTALDFAKEAGNQEIIGLLEKAATIK